MFSSELLTLSVILRVFQMRPRSNYITTSHLCLHGDVKAALFCNCQVLKDWRKSPGELYSQEELRMALSSFSLLFRAAVAVVEKHKAPEKRFSL